MTRIAVARAGMTLSGAFLVARLLGSVRLIVISNLFSPADLGLFYTAFRLPDLVFQLVAAGALSSALIPVLTGILAKGEVPRAWALVSTVITLLLVGLAALALVAMVWTNQLVGLLAPGYTQAQTAETVELTRIMLLSPILLALGAVATSVLNARGQFLAAGAAPVFYNLGIIVGSLLLGGLLGIRGAAVAVVIGSGAHLLVQVPPVLRLGFRYRRRLAVHDPDTQTTLTLLAPRAIGLGVTQITVLVVTALATELGTSAVAAFNIAFALMQVPLGVISVPLAVVLLPVLSRQFAAELSGEFARAVTLALRLLLFLMITIGFLLAVVSGQLVALLFPTYDMATAAMISDAFVVFLLGLPAHAAIAVLARAFYARHDTRTPVVFAIVAVAINTCLAIVLVGPLALPGLALAIAVAAWVEAGGLLLVLKRQAPLAVGVIGRSFIHAVAAAGVAGLAAWAVVQRTMGAMDSGSLAALVEIAVASGAYLLVLLVLSRVLRADEPVILAGVARSAIRRSSP